MSYNSFTAIAPYVPLTDENRFLRTSAWWLPPQADFQKRGLPPCTRVPVSLHSGPDDPLPLVSLPAVVARKLNLPATVRIPRHRLRPVYNTVLWSLALHRVCKVIDFGTTDYHILKGA